MFKGAIEARPDYDWTKPHIEAHFLSCYVALTIMRLMQINVEKAAKERPSADRMARDLANTVGHHLDSSV